MLMMSAKMGTLGLLKINALWNKGYDVIIFFPYRHKQNFINWVKLCCRVGHVTKVCLLQHFFERSYHNLNFIRIWPGKAPFLRCALGSSSINWTGTRYGLEIFQQFGKRVKTESFGACTCVEVTGKKLLGGGGLPHSE